MIARHPRISFPPVSTNSPSDDTNAALSESLRDFSISPCNLNTDPGGDTDNEFDDDKNECGASGDIVNDDGPVECDDNDPDAVDWVDADADDGVDAEERGDE